MLDTVKLGVPLAEYQHKELINRLSVLDSWQWIQRNQKTGEMRSFRFKGLLTTDRHSFHRQIAWDIPDLYSPGETYLIFEFSVPKFWYGDNVRLLYDFVSALEYFRVSLQKELGFKLTKVTAWQLFRADVCYAWRCPSQELAQQLLDSLKTIHYPRKMPVIYRHSILFKGQTYSLKFYLKLPEFINHDRKTLLKGGAALEWVNHLESKAVGVLRYEVTLRRKYLKRHDIQTVGDFIYPRLNLVWDEEFIENYGAKLDDEILLHHCFYSIVTYTFYQQFLESGKSEPEMLQSMMAALSNRSPELAGISFKDGDCFYAPAHLTNISRDQQFEFLGGGFKVQVVGFAQRTLQNLLVKYLGENRDMSDADKIQALLLKQYKPVKASRLVGFWLYVQRFGTEKAKDNYGHDSYYRAKRELKDAGVSLIQPKRISSLNQEFLNSFKLHIPSSYVVNSMDDFRDSDNLLNLLPGEEE